MAKQKKDESKNQGVELTAEQAKDIVVRQWGTTGEEGHEGDVAGVTTNQEEAIPFLKWLADRYKLNS